MAISRNNPLTKGASGMIGNTFVFKTYNGKTVICNRPSKPKTQSPQQKENRSKFSRAVEFSRRMMADPQKKAEYKEIAKQQNLPNAYTAAVTEYMRKPEIDIEENNGFTGKPGDELKLIAKKKGFSIKEVEVIFLGKENTVLEVGKAILAAEASWIYSLKNQLAEGQEIQVLMKVIDRCNQLTERRIVVLI